MRIPYVIDNQTVRLADVLHGILEQHSGRGLDVATAPRLEGDVPRPRVDGSQVLREGDPIADGHA